MGVLREQDPLGRRGDSALHSSRSRRSSERDPLSRSLMTGGGKMPRRRVEPGETLVEQGEPGEDLFLLLDGVLDVEVDGDVVGEVGPARSSASAPSSAAASGRRRSGAVTACRVAVVAAEIRATATAELSATRDR